MFRITLAAALVALPALATAQTSASAPPAGAKAATTTVSTSAPDKQAETGQPPERIRSVTLANGQKCPESTPTDIVVCSTIPEPYRIPKQLRDSGPIPAARQSWTNKAAELDQIGRVAGGLPDTCSPVGSGGQTGCALQANQQWAAERRARAANDGQIPQ